MSVYHLLRNVFSSFALFGVSGLTGLILTPIMFRSLGPVNYAILVFSLAITAAVEALHLCFLSVLVRFVSDLAARKNYEQLRRLASTVFYLLAAAGVIAAGAVAALSPLLARFFHLQGTTAEPGSLTLAVMGLSLAFQLPCSALRGLLTGYEHFHLANGVDISVQLLRAGVMAFLLLTGSGLLAVAALFPAMGIIRLLGMLLAARRAAIPFRPALHEVDMASLRQVGRFISLTFLHETTMRWFLQLDSFLAAKLLPLSDLATLAIARRFPWTLVEISIQTTAVTYPMFSATAARDDRRALQRLLLIATRNVLALLLPLAMGLFIWAGVILSLWIGVQLPSGTSVFRALVVFAFFAGLQEIPVALFYGLGRLAFVAKLSVALLLGGAALGVWACSAHGLLGLAMVYALLQVLGTLLLVGQSLKFAQVTLARLWKTVAFPVLLAGFPTLAWFLISYHAVPHTLVGLTVSALGGALVFFGPFTWLATGPGNQGLERRVRKLLAED